MLTLVIELPMPGARVSMWHFEVYVRKIRHAEAYYAASGYIVSTPAKIGYECEPSELNLMFVMAHEEVTGQAGATAEILPWAWFSSSRVVMDLKLFMTFQVQKK